VNADGDGTADRLLTIPAAVADRPPGLELVLDEHADVGAALPLNDIVAAIGGFDINGDGRDELFVKTGQGAYATLIDVYEYDPAACTLTRLAVDDNGPPAFAVGASVGNGSGVTCDHGMLIATTLSRISDEPLRYEEIRKTLAIDGTALRVVRTDESQVDAAAAASAAAFDCGGLKLPPFAPPQ
jgi:hypothetical protein